MITKSSSRSHLPTQILEEFSSLLNKIIEGNIPVVVEGKNDRAALQELGLSLVLVLYKKPFYKLIESLHQFKEIVILTDLDKEGKKLYAKINDECSQRGIRVNNHLRKFLFKETALRQIEGLPNYLRKIAKLKEYKYFTDSSFSSL